MEICGRDKLAWTTDEVLQLTQSTLASQAATRVDAAPAGMNHHLIFYLSDGANLNPGNNKPFYRHP